MSRVLVPLRRTALIVCACASLLGGARVAFAQKGSIGAAEESRATQAILRERNRTTLHPGDPLKISGIDQGENDIRSRTPALANSDRTAAMLEPEEHYRRTIAMYEDRALFPEPPTLVADPHPRPVAPPHPRKSSVETVSNAGPWPWVIGIGLTAIVLSLWVQKRYGLSLVR